MSRHVTMSRLGIGSSDIGHDLTVQYHNSTPDVPTSDTTYHHYATTRHTKFQDKSLPFSTLSQLGTRRSDICHYIKQLCHRSAHEVPTPATTCHYYVTTLTAGDDDKRPITDDRRPTPARTDGGATAWPRGEPDGATDGARNDDGSAEKGL